MHDIAVNSVNVTEPVGFGLTKFDRRKNQGSRFRKRTSSCTRIRTDRIVGSHLGGTGTSLVGSCLAHRMCSLLGGTDIWLWWRD